MGRKKNNDNSQTIQDVFDRGRDEGYIEALKDVITQLKDAMKLSESYEVDLENVITEYIQEVEQMIQEKDYNSENIQ